MKFIFEQQKFYEAIKLLIIRLAQNERMENTRDLSKK